MTTEGRSVDEAIERWRPRQVSQAAAAFARRVVAAGRPPSAARARTLLWSCSRLAAFGEEVGLELVPAVLLHPSVIERFVLVGLSSAPMPRRRTVRTNLRHLARRTGLGLVEPEPAALARNRAKRPYGQAEIEAFLALADTQPTAARRHRLAALVCLGAGAGLTGTDLRYVRGIDICRRHGGMVVIVAGGRAPRTVPVLACYHDRLLSAADFAGEGFITGGVSAERRNITNRLVAGAAASDVGSIELGRLRAAWLAHHAMALGLPVLFSAAGFSWSQQLGDLVATLAVGDQADAVRLLGGAS